MVRAKGFRLLAATALVVAISIGGSFAPSIASAFCCPAVVVVKLIPVDPVATPGLRGYAEVDECLGMSFLRIIVEETRRLLPEMVTHSVLCPGTEHPRPGDVVQPLTWVEHGQTKSSDSRVMAQRVGRDHGEVSGDVAQPPLLLAPEPLPVEPGHIGATAQSHPPTAPGRPLLFITGGSGITPVIGMLRALDSGADTAPDATLDDVVVVHHAPTDRESLFTDELDAMARQPHSAATQDWIRAQRKAARDKQARLGC